MPNRYMVKWIGAVLMLLVSIDINASDTLSLERYLDMVIEYHPLVQKANAYDDISDAYDLKRRGLLDPKISSDLDQKRFDEKRYFSIWQSEAKVATPWPVDFAIGYEQNQGLFLNEQNTIPGNGLVYGTVQLSLLRGLLYNEQRYQMQSMALSAAKSEIEREILMREIIAEAIQVYIDWTAAHQSYVIYTQYRDLVLDRHQLVLGLYQNGDAPAIDTIESRLTINTADKLWLEAREKLITYQQKLSLMVWDSEGRPLTLRDEVTPMALEKTVDALEKRVLLSDVDFQIDPYVRKIDNQIEALSLDNRIEKEQLKPQLDLKYNAIVSLGDQSIDPTLSMRDYKYGVTLQYPILNRKTKGNIALNNALKQQNELDRANHLGYLQTTYDALLSRRDILIDLVTVSERKINNSEQLYAAENLKFGLGESSVFLLNQRERKLLEAQTELIKNNQQLSRIMGDIYYLVLGQKKS